MRRVIPAAIAALLIGLAALVVVHRSGDMAVRRPSPPPATTPSLTPAEKHCVTYIALTLSTPPPAPSELVGLATPRLIERYASLPHPHRSIVIHATPAAISATSTEVRTRVDLTVAGAHTWLDMNCLMDNDLVAGEAA
jgi:hypothetical protein